jgi:hypothetical protein
MRLLLCSLTQPVQQSQQPCLQSEEGSAPAPNLGEFSVFPRTSLWRQSSKGRGCALGVGLNPKTQAINPKFLNSDLGAPSPQQRPALHFVGIHGVGSRACIFEMFTCTDCHDPWTLSKPPQKGTRTHAPAETLAPLHRHRWNGARPHI